MSGVLQGKGNAAFRGEKIKLPSHSSSCTAIALYHATITLSCAIGEGLGCQIFITLGNLERSEKYRSYIFEQCILVLAFLTAMVKAFSDGIDYFCFGIDKNFTF